MLKNVLLRELKFSLLIFIFCHIDLIISGCENVIFSLKERREKLDNKSTIYQSKKASTQFNEHKFVVRY